MDEPCRGEQLLQEEDAKHMGVTTVDPPCGPILMCRAGSPTFGLANVARRAFQLSGRRFFRLEIWPEEQPIDRLGKMRIEASAVDTDRFQLRKLAARSVLRVPLLEANSESLNPGGIQGQRDVRMLPE